MNELLNKKFSFFLNAVHYCMWRKLIAQHIFLRRTFLVLFSHIPAGIFSKKRREIYNRQILDNNIEDFFRNNKDGFCISWAHHWTGYFSACYPGFISFVLLGLETRLFGSLSPFVDLLLIFGPIGICYIPVYKALYTKDRYLKYFKRFEKEDEQWHRKWSRITTLFCVGAIIMFVGGIAAMILIGS